MALHSKRVDRYFNTIWAIAASKYVKKFHIGYTSRAGFGRFTDYKRFGFDHLVILADKLTEKEAKTLEDDLQQRCRRDKRELPWRKYHDKRRKLSYRPGFASPTPLKKSHSVYMVWWEP